MDGSQFWIVVALDGSQTPQVFGPYGIEEANSHRLELIFAYPTGAKISPVLLAHTPAEAESRASSYFGN